MKRAWPLIAALSIAACSREPSGPPGPAVSLAAVDVRVAPAALVRELPAEVPAAIEARHEAVLASRVSATIESVRAEVGDRVSAGQVLVTLDARDVTARVAAAEAALRAARSHHDRVQALFAKEAATEREVEAAQAGRDAAQAGLDAARAEGSYVRLAAPFAGRVTARMVSAGDLARPGEPLLMIQKERDAGRGSPGRHAAAPGSLRAAATVTADQAARIAVGDRLEVVLEDGSTQSARVTVVNTAGDPASLRFLVKADLPIESTARAGSFARLRLQVPVDPPLVAAPATALFERGALTGLFVVEDGRARLRWVSAGEPVSGGRVIVRAGLRAEEMVVLDPARVVDGTPVRATP